MKLPDLIASRISQPKDCWLWTGSLSAKGYGTVFFDGRNQAAHRVVYELLVRPIDDGYQLDHLCRVRCCVNPSHLEPVTLAENLRRGRPMHQTHCKHGHPFTEDNTYRQPSNPYRRCRTCKKLRNQLRAQGQN